MRRPMTILGLLAAMLALPASGQEFSVQVLPPRVEDSAEPGATYRNVIEIQNASSRPVELGIRTADWTLASDGSAKFDYALAPASCRPWVGLEAAQVQLAPRDRKRLRFEVAIPADAPTGQCRFALMVEGRPQRNHAGMAVAGRIGVIVYLDIGDAAASLRVTGGRVVNVEGHDLPALVVVNEGNAHGRLEGLVNGVDAAGQRWALVPAHEPILPGTQRVIALHPMDESDAPPPALAFPVVVKGRLGWGSQRIPVEATAGQ